MMVKLTRLTTTILLGVGLVSGGLQAAAGAGSAGGSDARTTGVKVGLRPEGALQHRLIITSRITDWRHEIVAPDLVADKFGHTIYRQCGSAGNAGDFHEGHYGTCPLPDCGRLNARHKDEVDYARLTREFTQAVEQDFQV
ncbi:MAG TPA: hypothetical protein VJJ83_04270, partial [Candidatus Babeliales bacterium]|nr:hypothetical protein [Candidatus Babeliales bacterium]